MPGMQSATGFKKQRDEWAETIGEWRDRTASLGTAHAGGQAHRGLPNDLLGRYLQDLWRLRPR
jgi:hypothetical protein